MFHEDGFDCVQGAMLAGYGSIRGALVVMLHTCAEQCFRFCVRPVVLYPCVRRTCLSFPLKTESLFQFRRKVK